MGKAALSALLEEAQTVPSVGPRCWAAMIDGEAAEFLAVLRQKVEAKEYVSWEQVSRVLKREWGVDKDATQVARHLKRQCKCNG